MFSPDRSLKVCNHSATFDWGKSCSSAAQLALAILLDIMPPQLQTYAESHYLKFEEMLIELPLDKWEIEANNVVEWLRLKIPGYDNAVIRAESPVPEQRGLFG